MRPDGSVSGSSGSGSGGSSGSSASGGSGSGDSGRPRPPSVRDPWREGKPPAGARQPAPGQRSAPPRGAPSQGRPAGAERKTAEQKTAEDRTEVLPAARSDTPTEVLSPARPARAAQPAPTRPDLSKPRTPEPAFSSPPPAQPPEAAATEVFRKAEPGGPDAPDRPERDAAGAPPPRRRRRTILIVALVLVLALLAVGDRLAARFAAAEVVKQIQSSEQLPTKPKAKFGGIPFLTQPIFGKYTDLGVTIDRIATPGPCIDEMSAHLKGMHVPLTDGISGKIGSVPVDHVSGSVRVTFADLNTYLASHPVSLGPLGSLKLHAAPADGGAVVWSATGGVITGTGQQQPDQGSLKVKLGVSGQNLTVAVVGFTVNQIPGLGSLGSGLLNQLGANLGNFGGVPALPLPIPLSDLPFSPRLTKVDTSAKGLEIGIAADHIKLPAPSGSAKGQPVKGC